jgi:SAM-dependent methyltransferase
MMSEGETGSQDKRFYDTLFSGSAEDLHARIRVDAFGEEIGQNSWLTADEHRRFFTWLELGVESEVLEVASGTGGPALFMLTETGCSVTGVDLHEAGVAAANGAAAAHGVGDRARFVQADARAPLPFDDDSFDAALCIDSINHVYERARLLGELWRVLREGGRLLFTDPIVLTGMLRREEMIIRSGSMGEFVFSSPGANERLLKEAGFVDVRTEDVTENMASVAAAWRDSRERHADELREIEGAVARDSLQEFLGVVHLVASERRLSRFAYLARKPAPKGSPP